METRKERYRRLREDIKSMPDSSITGSSFSAEPLPMEQPVESPSLPPKQEEPSPAPKAKSVSRETAPKARASSDLDNPYMAYVANRKRAFLIKVILAGIVVLGFLVWLITLIVRSK